MKNNILPIIERWDTHPFDLHDPFKRFKKSNFNYFFKDPTFGVVVGYWEAEDGYEDLGSEGFHELIHVIEGKLIVRVNSQDEIIYQGDTIVIKNECPCRIIVKEAIKALFVCYGMEDIEKYEKDIKRSLGNG